MVCVDNYILCIFSENGKHIHGVCKANKNRAHGLLSTKVYTHFTQYFCFRQVDVCHIRYCALHLVVLAVSTHIHTPITRYASVQSQQTNKKN